MYDVINNVTAEIENSCQKRRTHNGWRIEYPQRKKDILLHDVVAKLRGILHMKKIGHTGTLDPDAEGVLPVVLGKATRLVDLLTEKQKTYEALMHLGLETDTQDMTGTVLEEKPVEVTEEEYVGSDQEFPGRIAADSADVFCTEGKRKETL